MLTHRLKKRRKLAPDRLTNILSHLIGTCTGKHAHTESEEDIYIHIIQLGEELVY
jgi:hypothetical protein